CSSPTPACSTRSRRPSWRSCPRALRRWPGSGPAGGRGGGWGARATGPPPRSRACCARPPAGVDALAGLELGGVPLATMMSQLNGLPTRFVRKEAKTYGTCRLAEGGALEGQRLCIIEDVVTSGGAILDAARELRDRGAVLGPVVCVIDRESGGLEKLAVEGL